MPLPQTALPGRVFHLTCYYLPPIYPTTLAFPPRCTACTVLLCCCHAILPPPTCLQLHSVHSCMDLPGTAGACLPCTCQGCLGTQPPYTLPPPAWVVGGMHTCTLFSALLLCATLPSPPATPGSCHYTCLPLYTCLSYGLLPPACIPQCTHTPDFPHPSNTSCCRRRDSLGPGTCRLPACLDSPAWVRGLLYYSIATLPGFCHRFVLPGAAMRTAYAITLLPNTPAPCQQQHHHYAICAPTCHFTAIHTGLMPPYTWDANVCLLVLYSAPCLRTLPLPAFRAHRRDAANSHLPLFLPPPAAATPAWASIYAWDACVGLLPPPLPHTLHTCTSACSLSAATCRRCLCTQVSYLARYSVLIYTPLHWAAAGALCTGTCLPCTLLLQVGWVLHPLGWDSTTFSCLPARLFLPAPAPPLPLGSPPACHILPRTPLAGIYYYARFCWIVRLPFLGAVTWNARLRRLPLPGCLPPALGFVPATCLGQVPGPAVCLYCCHRSCLTFLPLFLPGICTHWDSARGPHYVTTCLTRLHRHLLHLRMHCRSACCLGSHSAGLDLIARTCLARCLCQQQR